jgi:hypothetical protein
MPKPSPIATAAAKKTDEKFAKELSDATVFTPEEIKALFPAQQDADEFKKLVDAVKAATDENDKKTKLIANISSVASVISRLAKLA